MATFAVNASDEMVRRLSELMDSMSREGEKKADTLQRIFRIAVENADGDTLKSNGVDVSALDAAQENIRAMFVAAVTGREQIEENCNQRIAEIRDKKDALETDLRAKITVAEEARLQAEKDASEAAKTAAQAVNDAKAAKDSAETNSALAKEKDKTILSLTDKLTAAEAKAEGYDELVMAKQKADGEIAVLKAQISTEQKEHARVLAEEKKASERALKDAIKDAEVRIRELKAQMDRAVSDTQKDAALEQEQAVAKAVGAAQAEAQAKMQKIQEQAQIEIRKIDRENARLSARIEQMQDLIKELNDQLKVLQEKKNTK